MTKAGQARPSNRPGFDVLYLRYAGGRPPTFTLPQRREIKKIALSIPTDLDRPFATWSLAKLADYLVAEGVVTDISHEGLRANCFVRKASLFKR